MQKQFVLSGSSCFGLNLTSHSILGRGPSKHYWPLQGVACRRTRDVDEILCVYLGLSFENGYEMPISVTGIVAESRYGAYCLPVGPDAGIS